MTKEASTKGAFDFSLRVHRRNVTLKHVAWHDEGMQLGRWQDDTMCDYCATHAREGGGIEPPFSDSWKRGKDSVIVVRAGDFIVDHTNFDERSRHISDKEVQTPFDLSFANENEEDITESVVLGNSALTISPFLYSEYIAPRSSVFLHSIFVYQREVVRKRTEKKKK
jgi:hypothetical protein